ATRFAEALGRRDTELAPVVVGRRWVGWAIGAVALAVAGVGGTLFVSRSRTAGSLDSDLLAVAPFDVRGAGLSLWSEGLVEYLSRSLDGAGELRTVSPSVFLRGWSGPADPASARDLGRRTGARLVVFGSLVRGGLDSVRLRATLLDVADGQSQAEVDVPGDTLAIDRVADSLAVALLRELGRTRPVAAVRNAPFSWASLPALKEFLRGEQFYRRGQYDAALAHHARAAALDSSFALAYRRMALVLGWGPPTSGAFEGADVYAFKAASLNLGLTVRDSLLIAADSCYYALLYADSVPESDQTMLRARLFATLNEAARRFPGDPEVWQAVGEARYHAAAPFQPFATPPEILSAFATAIALDPGFTPAYEHVLELALRKGQPDLARRYALSYLIRTSGEEHVGALRLAALLLDPVRSSSPEMRRLLDTIAVGPLFFAATNISAWPDSEERTIQMFRALPQGRRGVAGLTPAWADTLVWPQYLAKFLLYRGHAREAYQVYRPLISNPSPNWWQWFLNPLRDLALLNAGPADSVVARIAGSEAELLASPHDRSAPPHWLAWWFARRDSTVLKRIGERNGRVASTATSPRVRLRARYLQGAAAAYLTLLRGDSIGARRGFDVLPDSSCAWLDCSLEKLTLTRLLTARGEDRQAGEILDQWLWICPSPFFVIARLERARIAERLGDRDTAVRWYQFVVDTWRHADLELQSYVTEAREGLSRLRAEPRL
ncbi:MAG: hypothetical protein ACREMF_07705, partial [Gemmatimonadales bacterium]